MNEISRLAKALVDQIRQTKLFCASESCVNNRGSGECALRDVMIEDGKCYNFEPVAEKPKS